MTYIPTYEREAYNEGKMEERLKNAREMAKIGIEFPIISKVTGLPIKEIEAMAVTVQN
jgi:hypothetical protein